MGRDITIHAPPAVMYGAGAPAQLEAHSLSLVPSPDEIIQMQDIEIRRLQNELRQLHVTSGTIANATVALTKLLLDRDDNLRDEVRISPELRYRIDGAQVQVRIDADGAIYVSYVGGDRPVFDGRTDD